MARSGIATLVGAALVGAALGRTAIGSARADTNVRCQAWDVAQWSPMTPWQQNGSAQVAPHFDSGTATVPDGWEPFGVGRDGYALRRCRG